MAEESKIVEAVGIVSGKSGGRNIGRAQVVEAAMSQAVKDAMEDGIALDSDELKERMQEARQQAIERLDLEESAPPVPESELETPSDE